MCILGWYGKPSETLCGVGEGILMGQTSLKHKHILIFRAVHLKANDLLLWVSPVSPPPPGEM
jgi:hypothetical protein